MIRRVTKEDKRIYLELATEFYQSDGVLHPIPASYMEATFEEMITSNRYVEGFLIEVEGRAAGYGLISKGFSQESGGQVIWIEELYIREDFRGQKLGSKFFAFVEEAFPEATRFRLEVEEENAAAARLYARLGYEDLAYNQMVKEKH